MRVGKKTSPQSKKKVIVPLVLVLALGTAAVFLIRYFEIPLSTTTLIYGVLGIIILDGLFLWHKLHRHSKRRKKKVHPLPTALIALAAILIFSVAFFYQSWLGMGAGTLLYVITLLGRLKHKKVVISHKPQIRQLPKKKISLFLLCISIALLGYSLYIKNTTGAVLFGIVALMSLVGFRPSKSETTREKKHITKKQVMLALLIISLLVFIISVIIKQAIAIIVSILGMIVSFTSLGRKPKSTTQKPMPQEQTKKVMRPKIVALHELPKQLKIPLSGNETELDVLCKIVQQKGYVKLSALSKYFEVDKKVIEEWASILEEQNLVKINYPIIGEIEIGKCEN